MLTKEQRDEMRRACSNAVEVAETLRGAGLTGAAALREGLAGNCALLLDAIDEMERKGVELGRLVDCDAPPWADCALPLGSLCNAHTINRLAEERRQLRLELAAQQEEARDLRRQLAEATVGKFAEET